MKKIISLLILLLLITGCDKEKKKENNNPVKKEESVEIIDTYKDNNPVKVAFYEGNKILKEYHTNLNPLTDINVFGVIFTNEEEITNGSFKSQFIQYYNNHQEKEKYKIGYYIKFYVGDKLYEKTIIDPTSTFSLEPYIYVYLYDDIHQVDGAWYSHIEEADVKEDTLYTSIKLFKFRNSKEISSPITLEVFTYDGEDDFDEDGNYRGISKYSIEIKTNS